MSFRAGSPVAFVLVPTVPRSIDVKAKTSRLDGSRCSILDLSSLQVIYP